MVLSWWGKGPVPPAVLSSLPHCAAIATEALHLRESAGGKETVKKGRRKKVQKEGFLFRIHVFNYTSLIALSVSLRYLVATA